MLALRSYGQSNGFSVMDADELFFINGGSGNTEKETKIEIQYEDEHRKGSITVEKKSKSSDTSSN